MGSAVRIPFVRFVPPESLPGSLEVREAMRLLGDQRERSLFELAPPVPIPPRSPTAPTLWAAEAGGGMGAASGVRNRPVVRCARAGDPPPSTTPYRRMTIDPVELFLAYVDDLIEKGIRGPITFPAEAPLVIFNNSINDYVAYRRRSGGISPEMEDLLGTVQETTRLGVNFLKVAVIDRLKKRFGRFAILTGDDPKSVAVATGFKGNMVELAALVEFYRLAGEKKVSSEMMPDGELMAQFQRIEAALQEAGRRFIRGESMQPAVTEDQLEIPLWVYDSAEERMVLIEMDVPPYEAIDTLVIDIRRGVRIGLVGYAAAWMARIGQLGLVDSLRDLAEQVADRTARETKAELEELRKAIESCRGRFGGLPREIRERETIFPLFLERVGSLLEQIEAASELDLRKGKVVLQILRPHFGRGHLSRFFVQFLSGEPAPSYREIMTELAANQPDEDWFGPLMEEGRLLRDAEREERRRARTSGSLAALPAPIPGPRPVPPGATEPAAAEAALDDLLDQEAGRIQGEMARERALRESHRSILVHVVEQIGMALGALEGHLLELRGEQALAELEEEWVEVDGRTIRMRPAIDEEVARLRRRFEREMERPLTEKAGLAPLIEELRRVLDQIRGDGVFVQDTLLRK